MTKTIDQHQCIVCGKSMSDGIVCGPLVSMVHQEGECLRRREQELYKELYLEDYSSCSDINRVLNVLKHAAKDIQLSALPHLQQPPKQRIGKSDILLKNACLNLVCVLELVLLVCHRSRVYTCDDVLDAMFVDEEFRKYFETAA